MKKTISASILTALTSLGGMFGFYNHKLGVAEDEVVSIQAELDQAVAEKDEAIAEKNIVLSDKQEVINQTLYLKVRLNENPEIIPEISLNEIEQAYKDVVSEKNITVDFSKPVNLFDELRRKVISEGTACNI